MGRVRKIILSLLLIILALPVSSRSGIEGGYLFLEDQPGDISAAEGAEILLDIDVDGNMHLAATMPGDVLTTEGRYHLSGNLITIDFPELGKSVRDGTWSLREDILTLPLQFIADGEGESRWKRRAENDGCIFVFYQVVNGELGRGTDAPRAVQIAAREALDASVDMAQSDAERISDFEVWEDGAGCTFEFDDGHREHAFVPIKATSQRKRRRMLAGLWTRDPRTHIPAKPRSAPDDPKNKTAVLFVPFENAPYWTVSPAGTGKVDSFKESGEDVAALERLLESAHYRVEVLRDSNATPRALHEAIRRLKPSVLYISTHGGCTSNLAPHQDVFLATGVQLGTGLHEQEIRRGSPRLRKLLAQAMPAGYPSYLDPGRQVTRMTGAGTTTHAPALDLGALHPAFEPAWLQLTQARLVVLLGINSYFFERMAKELGDFSDSLVYVNACFGAHNDTLVDAMHPRVLIGYAFEATYLGSARLAEHFFRLLRKPTWSPREILGLQTMVVTSGQSIFFPEDTQLADVLAKDIENIRLYGADGLLCPQRNQLLPENPATGSCEIPGEDVIYLCWLARWSAEDPQAGCRALQHAYEQFWSKGSFSRLKASALAVAGVRGDHVPTFDEVQQAMHLVCGAPSLPCGRFTLNDADPSREPLR